MSKNYILGLDIGISSVGWGLLELDNNNIPYKIIDVGSRIFTPGETEKTGDSRAKERREKRGARRISRRREFRIDRVRNLLYENGYLSGKITSSIVSLKNEELSIIYDDMINNYYKNKNTNPYKLKVEALDRKLTSDELSIILVHYAKKRGYKSNREESSDKDSGKVLSAIKENETILKEKGYRTISEMYIKDDKFKNKIKNSPGDYKISVTNEMYLEEINKVLDSQIKFGLITKKFKNEYLEIYNSRRHYSMGPGGDSKYGGNLIERMVGKCTFDKMPRAPKMAPSSEIYVSLTKLINLRYISSTTTEYTSLNKKQINELINKSREKTSITYKDIVKVINEKEVKFKDLTLTKKEYGKVIEELKKELNLNKEEIIKINDLDDNKKSIYQTLYQNKLYEKKLIELKGYQELKKAFIKAFGKDAWEEEKDNLDLLDELARMCTNYKLNEDIKKNMEESLIIDEKYIDINFIELLPNFKDHLRLSTEIIRKLLPIMENGIKYDEAMKQIGYNHSDIESEKVKKDLLVPVTIDENLTKQRVIRSLTQTRKIINAIIKKYGSPKIINIETARELAKTKQERNEIEKIQKENKETNDKIKNELVELGLFSSIEKVNSTDLLKYKLWKEQNEFCAYGLEKIKLQDLFQNNIVQIDHILPYSRTYNDNYLNKTLVLTKNNQNKGNKTPYEWFGKTEKWTKYEAFINNLNISSRKKDNYLLKKLDFETEREMRNQNLNDTKYISKELSSLIKAYLNVEKVNIYQGALTAKLRARWGFNRLTHSYISNNYIMPEEMKKNINKDRDNHLHHAIDALIIASITPSLQQKITLYEKFSRYIDGLTKNQLSNLNYDEIEENNGIYYDEETGVIDEIKLKEYLKEQVSKEHIYFSKHNIARLNFPLPYDNFTEEAKIRVYERDEEILKEKIKTFNSYTKNDINSLKVLIPSIAKSKISGSMHKETYYGNKQIGETTYRTIRTPIEKIKKKDIENMPNICKGLNDTYNAINEWLGKYETGEEALKAHNGKYPINQHDKEQKEIKKVKIYTESNSNGHKLKNGTVDKGGIYKIEIYKSKNADDNKLYFAAYDILEIKKTNAINSGKTEDFNVKLDYGQSKNNLITTYKDLKENYILINSLTKNDLIEITMLDGRKSIAYVVGCSSGKLEIKSKLGDGYDIVGNNNIFEKRIERYVISVSQIKKIKKLSINLLGEISGL